MTTPRWRATAPSRTRPPVDDDTVPLFATAVALPAGVAAAAAAAAAADDAPVAVPAFSNLALVAKNFWQR